MGGDIKPQYRSGRGKGSVFKCLTCTTEEEEEGLYSSGHHTERDEDDERDEGQAFEQDMKEKLGYLLDAHGIKENVRDKIINDMLYSDSV